MLLEVDFEDFKKTRFFYEYIHAEIAKNIDHHTDGELIQRLKESVAGKKAIRRYNGSLMVLYRILTARNFETGIPLIQAYNPAARIEDSKIELFVRLGTFEPGRTFLGRTEIDNFGQGFINEESMIPDKIYKTNIFLRARLPYESIEDPRVSPVNNDMLFFVTVIRGPGLPIKEPVISWILKDGKIAPIMYKNIVLSDNRDSFQITRKLLAIRPNYKYAPRNVLAFGFFDKDNINVIDEVFTHPVFLPRNEEEKTGGSTAVSIGNGKYLFVYHIVYRGIGGLKGEGTAGIYLNYGVIIDEDGNLLAEIQEPLTPFDYPYSGQRPGVIFASGALILSGKLLDKIAPDIGNYLKDYNKVLFLFAGVDDESLAIFVQDLDTLLEKAKWL